MLSPDDFASLHSQPTIGLRCAGRLLGIKSRNAVYRAREAGDIPTIKVGGQYRVPTAKLRAMLGLPSQPPAITDSAPIAA